MDCVRKYPGGVRVSECRSRQSFFFRPCAVPYHSTVRRPSVPISVVRAPSFRPHISIVDCAQGPSLRTCPGGNTSLRSCLPSRGGVRRSWNWDVYRTFRRKHPTSCGERVVRHRTRNRAGGHGGIYWKNLGGSKIRDESSCSCAAPLFPTDELAAASPSKDERPCRAAECRTVVPWITQVAKAAPVTDASLVVSAFYTDAFLAPGPHSAGPEGGQAVGRVRLNSNPPLVN